ncbi:alpha-galactosidase [Nakamurella lactea]|uniref:alpha-galactosidase n=1 Tax=Nakamurella lactea TaxID=459515 RepID=UPI000416A4D6|nr:alpha-galactosidase [Nakamurella lactea]
MAQHPFNSAGAIGPKRTPPTWSVPDFDKHPPFSFTYGGVASSKLLPKWRHRSSGGRFSGGRIERHTWTDPVTGLAAVLDAKRFTSSGAVSWIVYFRNTSKIGTRLIGDVLALDLSTQRRSTEQLLIRSNNGSDARVVDFAPFELELTDGKCWLFSNSAGRPSDGIVAGESSPWRYFSGGDAPGYINSDQHSTVIAGGTATLTFTGTSITWIGVRNIDCGMADVFIDGEQAAVVDQYGTSWLKQQELFTRADLPDGEHTIMIQSRADRNPAGIGNNVNIDAFTVGRPGAEAEVINDDDARIVYGMQPVGSSSWVRNGWPYFNFDAGGEGLIAAVGWPGQWALQAERSGTEVRIRAGMAQVDQLQDGDRIQQAELTELWLQPGEEIRTPQIVLLPWSGADHHDGQNAWRAWFVDHHMPRTGGVPVPPLCPTQSNDYFDGQWDTAADELTWLNAYGEHGATPGTGGAHDHWWIDAGWYAVPEGASEDWNWPGTWYPDPNRYPDGLKPILDRAHELGMRSIVWFEPERVRKGTWVHQHHPEWLLPIEGNDDVHLLDFGNAEAQQWMTQTVGDMIEHDGIDVYREDFNIGPLQYWRENDTFGRRGMVQIRYVTGHLAYWRALQERKPGLVIDTCASGGKRLDIETLGLAVNLLRSDLVRHAVGNQSHLHALSSWVPLHGGVVRVTGSPTDLYDSRSAYGPSLHHALDVRQADAPWDTLNQTAAEWKAISGHFYGNFFPLTPGGSGDDIWVGWQFGQRDAFAGVVQVFRRADSQESSATLLLRGLTEKQRYAVTDRDSGDTQVLLGSELMNDGLKVSIDTAPAARILEYQRA